MTLSEPAEDEECSITLEPIREYRLPFMPEDEEAPNCVVEGRPNWQRPACRAATGSTRWPCSTTLSRTR
jgi:hypothetical protein